MQILSIKNYNNFLYKGLVKKVSMSVITYITFRLNNKEDCWRNGLEDWFIDSK